MHPSTLLLSLFVADLAAAATPGPNFLAVTEAAIHRSRRCAAAVVCGLVTANLAWATAVNAGLSALFRVAPWLYWGMKLFGGGYLIWLGVQLWMSKSEGPVRDGRGDLASPTDAYIRGLLTGLSNPKSLVYFSSIFTVFLAPGSPVWMRSAATAIVLFNTVLWYGTVAALFSRARVQRAYARVRRPVDRVAGTLMAAFGARIALER
jgi:RhtB (resistance to homoserine/threonine) family protein